MVVVRWFCKSSVFQFPLSFPKCPRRAVCGYKPSSRHQRYILYITFNSSDTFFPCYWTQEVLQLKTIRSCWSLCNCKKGNNLRLDSKAHPAAGKCLPTKLGCFFWPRNTAVQEVLSFSWRKRNMQCTWACFTTGTCLVPVAKPKFAFSSSCLSSTTKTSSSNPSSMKVPTLPVLPPQGSGTPHHNPIRDFCSEGPTPQPLLPESPANVTPLQYSQDSCFFSSSACACYPRKHGLK